MFTELSALPRQRQTYAQFTKRTSPTVKESALAKLALLDIWHQLYTNGQTTLYDIQDFAKKYQAKHAIEWFKKETFLYQCVNEALNTDNIEQIYLLHSYIADVHGQILGFKHQQQSIDSHTAVQTTEIKPHRDILYLATRHSEEDLDVLKSLQGELVTNKSFMLTSRSKKMALEKSQLVDSHLLLFEIQLDLTSSDISYADIAKSGESNMNDILLNFGIRFRVKNCTFDTADNVWLCCLEATHDEPHFLQQYQAMPLSECLTKLSSSNNEDTRLNGTLQSQVLSQSIISQRIFLTSNKQWKLPVTCRPIEWAHIIHIQALIEWQRNGLCKLPNKWIHAIQIYAQSDIQYLFDNLNVAYCLNHFGYIKHLFDKNSLAIQLIKTSISMCRRRLSPDHIVFSKSYQNLGVVFVDFGDYKTALTYHQRALKITRQLPPATQWATVLILRSMATICHRSKNFSEAHIYHTKASSVYKKYMDFLIQNKYLM